VIMSPGAELRLPPVEVTRLSAGEAPSQVRTLAEAERVHILKTLRQVNWVIAADETVLLPASVLRGRL
jgi:hypothetical protein